MSEPRFCHECGWMGYKSQCKKLRCPDCGCKTSDHVDGDESLPAIVAETDRRIDVKLDKIITGDSAVVLQSFPPDCIDLTVTSPPYDNLRTYNGFTFDFEAIAKELYRVTRVGGVVVWVVADATINGSETGTSFWQALHFMECGFKLHDTMIYQKSGVSPSTSRYYPAFEYMFVFSKGKPKTFNPINDRENKWGARWGKTRTRKGKDGRLGKSYPSKEPSKFGMRTNIWRYNQGGGYGADDKIAYKHPAIFPEALANDHILSWSNEGDTVLDCFCGSGTTPKMAKLLNRHYIGIEVSPEYVTIAENRLEFTEEQLAAIIGEIEAGRKMKGN